MSEGSKLRQAYYEWVIAREAERNALNEVFDRVRDLADYDPERAIDVLVAMLSGDEGHDV